jgi:hypothetical protein
MDLNIKLDSEAICDAIAKALATGQTLTRQSPLISVLSEAIKASENRMRSWAEEQVYTVLADESFRRSMRDTLKRAMLAEAESMGRKAARAAVNANEAK